MVAAAQVVANLVTTKLTFCHHCTEILALVFAEFIELVHFYHIIVQSVLVSGTITKVLDVVPVWDLQVAILRDDMVKGELEANVVP